MNTLNLGLSRCLLGENVRYDGGHQLDRWLTLTLGPFVDFVPVCPEVECGLPTPREAMRLVGDVDAPRLVTRSETADHTDKMQAWASGKLDELEKADLCGFVFKYGSPSSGMARVKVYPVGGGQPVLKGVGIFARMFMERFPLLPVEDDGRLNDAKIRDNFITRVFVMHRWRELVAGGKTLPGLLDFHTRHKLLLMAHSRPAYQELGRLVAQGKGRDMDELFSAYLEKLMQGLMVQATIKKHRNVLEHCLGYFKKQLSADEKQEMLEMLDKFGNGLVPLIVPITLINHYVRKYGEQYLVDQVYLHPHPSELKLMVQL